MRRSLLLGFALLTVSATSMRAQATVRVVDADSVPIPFAMVSLGNATPRATDSTGLVRFTSQLGEAEQFTVQRIGYRPFKETVRRSSSNGAFVVMLHALPRGLDTVRTIAARETPLSRTGFYDRMARVQNGAITGEFITPEELELRNANQISHMLRGRRSVTVGSVTTKGRSRAIVTGRGGGCSMTVLLDGVRVNGMVEAPIGNSAPTSMRQRNSSGTEDRDAEQTTRVSIDELTAARQIMAIEIYGSSANAPAELIPLTGGGSCGIIALWTGPRR